MNFYSRKDPYWRNWEHRKNNFYFAEIFNTIQLNTNPEIILFGRNHQNDYVEILNMISNAVKSFNKQLVRASYIIILIIQQDYISDLYLVKFLNITTKLSFPWKYKQSKTSTYITYITDTWKEWFY